MIIYIQFRSSVPLKRFIAIMKKFDYMHMDIISELNLLGLVISTNHKRLIEGTPREDHRIVSLEEVFELELLPTVESVESLLALWAGHPSDA